MTVKSCVTGPHNMVQQQDKGQCGKRQQWLSTGHCQHFFINATSKLARGDMSKGEEEEASHSKKDQFFDESVDEDVDISTDDTNLQSQQDELGASPNFPFGGRSRYGRAVSSIIDSCFKKLRQVPFFLPQ